MWYRIFYCKVQIKHNLIVARWKYCGGWIGIQEKIKNEGIRKKVEVAPFKENMAESCLRWFVHAKRRPIEALSKVAN